MSGDVPRYRINLQDGDTDIQISAGTDDLDLFTKKDLMKMVNAFKAAVRKAEEGDLEL